MYIFVSHTAGLAFNSHSPFTTRKSSFHMWSIVASIICAQILVKYSANEKNAFRYSERLKITFALSLLQFVNYTILQLVEENMLPQGVFNHSEPGSSSIPAAIIWDFKTVCLFTQESFDLEDLQWHCTSSHPGWSGMRVLVTVKAKQHFILENHFGERNETAYYFLPWNSQLF